jgi:hypothetical protein
MGFTELADRKYLSIDRLGSRSFIDNQCPRRCAAAACGRALLGQTTDVVQGLSIPGPLLYGNVTLAKNCDLIRPFY